MNPAAGTGLFGLPPQPNRTIVRTTATIVRLIFIPQNPTVAIGTAYFFWTFATDPNVVRLSSRWVCWDQYCKKLATDFTDSSGSPIILQIRTNPGKSVADFSAL